MGLQQQTTFIVLNRPFSWWPLTLMYSVTCLTMYVLVLFYHTRIYFYAVTVISRVTVLCSSNRGCHGNVCSTIALNSHYKHSDDASCAWSRNHKSWLRGCLRWCMKVMWDMSVKIVSGTTNTLMEYLIIQVAEDIVTTTVVNTSKYRL